MKPDSTVWSPHFTPADRGALDVDVIVIHTAETPETATSAEATANYFKTTDRDVSAHYCVDADSIVQCVRLDDVAWAAPGANHDGIQIELAGRAAQTVAQWKDAYSRNELELAAKLVAYLCKRSSIPVVSLHAADLLGDRRGITTHREVSLAFKRSTHWDPGSGFPMSSFLSRVRELVAAGPQHVDLPPKGVSAPPPTVRLGDVGWVVRRAQRFLVDIGYPLELDGVFGANTERAVRAFQKLKKLDVDGIVGPSTWSYLKLAQAQA